MTQATGGYVFGFDFAQVWRVGSSCYAMGTETDPENVANGTTTSAYLIRDPQTSGIPQISRENVTITGGNTVQAAHMFGAASIDPFTFEMGKLDAALAALMTGTSVDQTTNAYWSEFGYNEHKATLPRVGIMFSTVFQQTGADCDGATKWLNIIFPICQASPQWPAVAERTGPPSSFQIQPTFTTKRPNGDAFDSNLGFDNNKAYVYGTISEDGPIGITTHVADTSDTTYITGYRPLSTTVTVNNTPNHQTKDGVPTAATSVVTTTGVVTIPSATAAQVYVMMYETAFVAI